MGSLLIGIVDKPKAGEIGGNGATVEDLEPALPYGPTTNELVEQEADETGTGITSDDEASLEQ